MKSRRLTSDCGIAVFLRKRIQSSAASRRRARHELTTRNCLVGTLSEFGKGLAPFLTSVMKPIQVSLAKALTYHTEQAVATIFTDFLRCQKTALAAAPFFGDNHRHAQEVRAVKLKVAFTGG